MAKLRHLALIVEDPEASARFFAAAFGMKRTDGSGRVCRMSDGVISIALLEKEFDHEQIGIDHFGIWVDDIDQAQDRAIAAGAIPFGSRPATTTDGFYEVKLQTPDGIIFDLSDTGWPGASAVED